jgi:hypothetical protein
VSELNSSSQPSLTVFDPWKGFHRETPGVWGQDAMYMCVPGMDQAPSRQVYIYVYISISIYIYIYICINIYMYIYIYIYIYIYVYVYINIECECIYIYYDICRHIDMST